jgi:predicted membrane protein
LTVAAPAGGDGRVLTTMRATFVLAGSILGAWLAAVFTRAEQVGKWQGVIAATGLAGSPAAVIYQRAQLERLSEDYLQSLHTLALVQRERGTERWIHSRSS